jgi:hypothetical protein
MNARKGRTVKPPSDSTLKNMAYLLPREARKRLFEDLCKTIGKRVPERVSMVTGIGKTQVYRYLLPRYKSWQNRRREVMVPSPATTVRVIKALLKIGKIELVVDALDPVGNEMRKSYLKYFNWIKRLEKAYIITARAKLSIHETAGSECS